MLKIPATSLNLVWEWQAPWPESKVCVCVTVCGAPMVRAKSFHFSALGTSLLFATAPQEVEYQKDESEPLHTGCYW